MEISLLLIANKMRTQSIVHKFGGTSLATTERDLEALHLSLERRIAAPSDLLTVIVCSGTGKIDDTEEGKKATDHAYDIVNGKNRDGAWALLKRRFQENVHNHNLPQDTIDYLLGEAQCHLQSDNIDRIGKAKIIGLPERVKAQILYDVGKRDHPELQWKMLDYKQCLMFGVESHPENIDVPINHSRTLWEIGRFSQHEELKGQVLVIPGFIGMNERGEMITLERGMSDGTATYWGAGYYADEAIIWSDNNGISPVDPAIISGLTPIELLTYREAEAFAGLGAKIINDVAIRPARERGTRVRILNSFEPEKKGTLITANTSLEHYGVKAVAHVPGYYVITVSNMPMNQTGVAGKVSNIFSNCGVSIESEADGDSCRSYAVFPNGNLGNLLVALEEAGHRTESINMISRIALIGEGMSQLRRTRDRTAEQILFGVLAERGIDNLMYSRARGSVMLSGFIREEYTHQAVTYLARELGFN